MISDKLIYKKLTGEISPEENIEFDKWLAESDENELLFRRMKDVWHDGPFTPRIKGQENTYKIITGKIKDSRAYSQDGKVREIQRRSYPWYRIAVIIILFATVLSVFYLNQSSDEHQQASSSAITTKSNPAGQKTRINLPDGSICWLNSESEIQYQENFSDSARDIYLKGEAYFEVAKNEQKPFRVHTASMTVRAIGTVFNINSFPGGSVETVTLAEGRIAVEFENASYPEVMPGEAVEFNTQTKQSVKLQVDVDRHTCWKDGELVFDEDNLSGIILKMERWYGVEITVHGEIPKDLRFKGRFKNQLLENVLVSMQYGQKFDFRIDGKNVEIMFN